jgi:hypothetical protein
LESANPLPIVLGLNAIARPYIELSLRKRRRDLFVKIEIAVLRIRSRHEVEFIASSPY